MAILDGVPGGNDKVDPKGHEQQEQLSLHVNEIQRGKSTEAAALPSDTMSSKDMARLTEKVNTNFVARNEARIASVMNTGDKFAQAQLKEVLNHYYPPA